MLYKDIHASLLRFCSDYSATASARGTEIVPLYLDAHAEEDTLPPKDVVGISGLSMETDDGMVDVQVMIGIATINDTNLFRLVEYIDELFDRLQPDNLIQLYNSTTGANQGVLKVKNGTRVMPVAGTDTRPVQYIFVNLTSDRTMSR